MITVPAGVRIYLACGVTDMRRGFDGLSIMAQDVLKQDPFSGAIFCFRGRRGHLIKMPAQLSMLMEGLEWRNPRPTWQPTLAG